MKKTLYNLLIIMLMMTITTACTNDDENPNPPGNDSPAGYEVTEPCRYLLVLFKPLIHRV